MQRDTGIQTRENIAGRPASLGVKGRIGAAIIALEQAEAMIDGDGLEYPATTRRRINTALSTLTTAHHWANRKASND